MAFIKLTLMHHDENEDPEVFVNLDLAVCLKRSGTGTIIEFDAPPFSLMPTLLSDMPPRRQIEVTESPEAILERAPYRHPEVQG